MPTKKKTQFNRKNHFRILNEYISLRRHADEILIQENDLSITLSNIEKSITYKCFLFLYKLKKLFKIVTSKENYERFFELVVLFIKKMYVHLLLFTPFRKPDIIVFGIIAYRYRKQRPQHLCEYLSNRGYRVFYIENGFIPDSREFNSKELQPIIVNKYAKNVYLISLTATRDISIYSEEATLEDKKRIFSSIDTLKRVFGLRKVISIVQHPFWYQFAPFLSTPVIYDCMDEHIGFENTAKRMSVFERALAAKSASIIVTSKYLYRKMFRFKHKCTFIQNAGEYNHFSFKKEMIAPKDLEGLQKPIIGYYGAIAHWFNVKIIELIASAFPEVSIVLIGEITHSSINLLAKKHKNIHLLGEKPYNTLPFYLNLFDVCLIPFSKIPLTLATNPVKIFEYFAQGKPVVSTMLPELISYKKLMYLAANPKQFVTQVKNALHEEKTSIVRENRMKIAQENTWEDRGQQLEKIVLNVERAFYEHQI